MKPRNPEALDQGMRARQRMVSEMLRSSIERESDEQLARWWAQARAAAHAVYA